MPSTKKKVIEMMDDPLLLVRQQFRNLLERHMDKNDTPAQRWFAGRLQSLPDFCVMLWDDHEPLPIRYYHDLRELAGHEFRFWQRRGGMYGDAARIIHCKLSSEAGTLSNTNGRWKSAMLRDRPSSTSTQLPNQ